MNYLCITVNKYANAIQFIMLIFLRYCNCMTAPSEFYSVIQLE